MIWFTSDWHFCHNKAFIYRDRSFEDITEMNKTIVNYYNSLVEKDDVVYCLGDCMLGKNFIEGINYISQLKGHIKLILGNHDTENKIKYYKTLPNLEIIGYADLIKYQKYTFYLSHYPTYVDNRQKEPKRWCLHGHTHQENYFSEIFNNFHVGVDSNFFFPISIDNVIEQIRKVNK